MVVPAIVAPAIPPTAKLIDLDDPELARTIGVFRRADVAASRLLDPLIEQLVDTVHATPGVTRLGTADTPLTLDRPIDP